MKFPLATPRGTFTESVSVSETLPSPPQLLQLSRSVRPSPRHFGHTETLTNWPKIDCCTRRTCPRPWHWAQLTSPSPPRPPQVAHGVRCLTRIFFSTPLATSSRVSFTRTCRSSPRVAEARPERPSPNRSSKPEPPPKSRMNARRASARSNPLKS